jgi:DNA-binding XRE family transcriptional regulator
MMMRAFLANALRQTAPSSADIMEIADRAGGLRRQALLARAAKPVNAGAFLALCGAIGIDPVDGSSRAIKAVPASISWALVGAGLKITRQLRGYNQRSVARIAEISASTVCRVETGKPVSVESLLAICRFIGAHPDDYAVSCFTGNRH